MGEAVRNGSGGDTPGSARAARLKAALKANLGRRKAQARGRGGSGGLPGDGSRGETTADAQAGSAPDPGDGQARGTEPPKGPDGKA